MSGFEPILLAGAVAATAGGGLLAARGQQLAGQETARAAEFERHQLEVQAQTQRTAADQAEAARTRELVSNLETIQAIRAGRGVGSYSPTGEAILTNTVADAERNIRIERANFLSKADLASRASVLAGRKAKTSLLAGNLSAGATILNTAGKAASLYAYPSTRVAV